MKLSDGLIMILSALSLITNLLLTKPALANKEYFFRDFYWNETTDSVKNERKIEKHPLKDQMYQSEYVIINLNDKEEKELVGVPLETKYKALFHDNKLWRLIIFFKIDPANKKHKYYFNRLDDSLTYRYGPGKYNYNAKAHKLNPVPNSKKFKFIEIPVTRKVWHHGDTKYALESSDEKSLKLEVTNTAIKKQIEESVLEQGW